jgi:hypothetical protein
MAPAGAPSWSTAGAEVGAIGSPVASRPALHDRTLLRTADVDDDTAEHVAYDLPSITTAVS